MWRLLCERAQQLSGAAAVTDASGSLTYAQLLDEARAWARSLRAGGVGPGVAVACMVPRGVRAVVAQLAVFAAGAVYVPVSADDPPHRVRELLAGVDARHVLTLSGQSPPVGVDRFDMDEPVPHHQGVDPVDVQELPGPSPEMLAYIIHTSGTSGRPKPVAVTHGAIAHTMQAYARRFAAPVRCMAVVSPMTTDASLPGIWLPLLVSGTVWLGSAEPQQALTDLAHQLSAGAVSHVLLTPSLYGAVLPRLEGPSAHLRQVMVGESPARANWPPTITAGCRA